MDTPQPPRITRTNPYGDRDWAELHGKFHDDPEIGPLLFMNPDGSLCFGVNDEDESLQCDGTCTCYEDPLTLNGRLSAELHRILMGLEPLAPISDQKGWQPRGY